MTDLKRLIKIFCFDEQSRLGITLSDPTKIRLNTDFSSKLPGQIQLNGGFDDVSPFPLDTDLSVKTRLTTPNGVKQWLTFEASKDVPVGTSISYRFDNGAREIYWDGAAWETAGATDWNTEAEIQTNFSTFPFDNNSIAVVSNLVTTDPRLTPKLYNIKLLGLFEYEVLEDTIRTILLKLNDDIRPITDAAAAVFTTTSTFDFAGDYKLQNQGYNITDVPRIYNKTDDAFEKVNLFDTYTPGALNQDGMTNAAGIATTNSSIDAGKIVKFKIEYVPEIADYTDEDFYEPAKIPLIAFESVQELNRRDGLNYDGAGSPTTSAGLVIKDLTNMTAVQVLPPAQIDLRIGYAVFTDSSRDQKRILDAIEKFLQENKLIYSHAFDEPLMLNPVLRARYEPKGTSGNIKVASGEFDIRGINLFSISAQDVSLIENVNVDITT